MAAKWNSNGNWLLTGSRDHLLKLFDIRMMKELQTFRGHKKEATGKRRSIKYLVSLSYDLCRSPYYNEKIKNMHYVISYVVVAWHPVHETLFASGGSDGSLMFWLTGYGFISLFSNTIRISSDSSFQKVRHFGYRASFS